MKRSQPLAGLTSDNGRLTAHFSLITFRNSDPADPSARGRVLLHIPLSKPSEIAYLRRKRRKTPDSLGFSSGMGNAGKGRNGSKKL